MFTSKTVLASLSAIALVGFAPITDAAPIAYFSASGVQGLGNPQGWGGVNNTGQSVAFELTFDFTTAVDAITDPIVLWEAGATGNGAALVLNNDEMHFFAGNSNTDVVTGNHGLTALADDVQVVSVFDVNGGNELLSLYVNGELIAGGAVDAASAWAGSDAGGLGLEQGAARTRYVGTSLFDNAVSDISQFPNDGTDISLNVYRLASSGGNADNTLDNILVPSPSALLMGAAGLGLCALRRRRA